jgi:chromosome segregation and condensation protein ScpB
MESKPTRTTADLLRLLAEARERRINRVVEALLGAQEMGVPLERLAEVLVTKDEAPEPPKLALS